MPTLLQQLGKALWGRPQTCTCDPSSPALRLAVRCQRCGEIVRTRVEKAYEVEAEYDTNGHGEDEHEEPRPSGFTLHKDLLGSQCQNLIHVVMHFDAHRYCTQRSAEGGEIVEITDCE